MAKKQGKKADNSCGVKKVGDEFFCVDCEAKVTMNHNCPNCGREINWGTALADLHRIGPSTF